MRIVFFGTSEVGMPILSALLGAGHEVLHVVTSPDSPVGRKQELIETPIAKLAKELGLPISKPQKIKNNPEFLEFLRGLDADIFVIVSYGKIVPQELIDIPPLKTINVHFSLLPKYRGAAPIQFALLNGEETSGTTIFILDEQVDHGPVLAKQKIAIEPDDTFATLAPKLSDLSAQLLINILPQYAAGEIMPLEQIHEDATFTKLISKVDGKVDWNKTAPEIYNQWRAFTPWPGIWTTFEGQILKILECEIVDAPDTPNAFTDLPDIIPCEGHTFLRLIKIQLAGKNPTSMKDFLNGRHTFTPASLGQ
jgi:methionyl-tRNA formyltransferase